METARDLLWVVQVKFINDIVMGCTTENHTPDSIFYGCTFHHTKFRGKPKLLLELEKVHMVIILTNLSYFHFFKFYLD